MRVLVITPPAPLVTWADADAHLRLSGDETDRLYVEGLIAAATAHIDGPEGWLGRALGVQTLEARFSAAASSRFLRLPYPPFLEFVSGLYVDELGVEQELVAEDLEVLGSDLSAVSGVFPWSGRPLRREAVRVRYKAGYPNGVPAPIRVAILMMVGDMYRNRTTTQPGTQSAVPMSIKVEDLLAPFRVYR